MSDFGDDLTLQAAIDLTLGAGSADALAAGMNELFARIEGEAAASGERTGRVWSESQKRGAEAGLKGVFDGAKANYDAYYRSIQQTIKVGSERWLASERAGYDASSAVLRRKLERDRIAQEGGWTKRLEILRSGNAREEEAQKAESARLLNTQQSANRQIESAQRLVNAQTLQNQRVAAATSFQEKQRIDSRALADLKAFHSSQLEAERAHNERMTAIIKTGLRAFGDVYRETLVGLRRTWETGLNAIGDTIRGFWSRRSKDDKIVSDQAVGELKSRFGRENTVIRDNLATQDGLYGKGRAGAVGGGGISAPTRSGLGAAAVIGAGTVAASGELALLEGQSEALSTPWERLRGSVSGVAIGISLAAGAAAGFLRSTVSTATGLGEQILKIQRYTGDSAKGASDLRFAFQQTGVDIDNAAKALGIFDKNLVAGKVDGYAGAQKNLATHTKAVEVVTRTLESARRSLSDLEERDHAKKVLTIADHQALEAAVRRVGDAQAKLSELQAKGVDTATKYGFSVRDAAGNLLPMDQILLNVAEKFASMPDGIEKTNIALSIFGRGGAEMIKFLDRGRDGLQALFDEAHRFGLELTGPNLEAVHKHIMVTREWTAAWQGIQFQIGLAVLPLLTAVTSFLARNMFPAFQAISSFLSDSFGPVLRVVSGLWQGVSDAAQELWDKLSAYPQILGSATKFLKGVGIALAVIVAGGGAVKVIETLHTALDVLAGSPLFRTVTLLSLLGGALFALYETSQPTQDFFNGLVTGTKNWFQAGYVLDGTYDKLSGFVKLQTGLGAAARTLHDFFFGIVDGTKGWFEVGFKIDKVVNSLSPLVAVQSAIGAVARTFVNDLGLIRGAMSDLFSGDFSGARAKLGRFGDDLGKVLSPLSGRIADWLHRAADAARGAIGDFFGSLFGGAAGDNRAASTIGSRIHDAVLSGLKTAAESTGSVVTNFFSTLFGGKALGGNDVAANVGRQIRDTIAAALKWLGSNTADLISGLTSGIGTSAAGGFFGGIMAAISKSASPSTARVVGATLRNWLNTALSAAWDSIDGFWNGLIGRLGTGNEVANRLGAVLGGALSSAWHAVADHVDFGSLLGLVERAVQWIGFNIARIMGSKQFLDVLGSVVLAFGGLGVDMAVQFTTGFLSGLWNRRGDIVDEIGKILGLAFSNPITALVTILATAFGGAKLLGAIGGVIGKVGELRTNLQVAGKLWTGQTEEAQKLRDAAIKSNEAMKGVGTGSGIVDFTNKAANARDAIKSVVDHAGTIPAKLIDAGSKVSEFGAKTASAANMSILFAERGPVAEFGQRIKAGMGDAVDVVGKGMASVGSAAQEMGRAVAETASKGGAAVKQYLTDNFSGAEGKMRAAAVAASLVGGYLGGEMIANAQHASDALIGVASAAAGIATAFATGGPVGGIAAIAATVFGFITHEGDKAAAAVKAKMAEVSAEVKRGTQSVFDALKGTNLGDPFAALTSAQGIVLDRFAQNTDGFRDKMKVLGLNAADLGAALIKSGGDWSKFTQAVVGTNLQEVISGQSGALSRWKDQVSKAGDTWYEYATIVEKHPLSDAQASKIADQVDAGTLAINGIAAALVKMHVPQAEANELQANYTKLIKDGIQASDPYQSALANLRSEWDQGKKSASDYQNAAKNVKNQQDAARSPTEKIRDAFSSEKDAISKATDALNGYFSALNGGAKTRDQAIVDTAQSSDQFADLVRQINFLKSGGADFTLQQAQLNTLVASMQDKLGPAVVQMWADAGGSMDKFTQGLNDLENQMLPALQQVFETKGEAPADALRDAKSEADLLFARFRDPAQMKVIANTSQFQDAVAAAQHQKDVLTDPKTILLQINTDPVQAGVKDVLGSFQTYINSNPKTKALLDKLDPDRKMLVLQYLFDVYAKSDPTAIAKLGGTPDIQLIEIMRILRVIAAPGVLAPVKPDVNQDDIKRGLDVARLYAAQHPIHVPFVPDLSDLGSRVLHGFGFAEGGFTPREPAVALVHPNEVVLPLSDKMRVKELLSQRGLAAFITQLLPPTATTLAPVPTMPLSPAALPTPVPQHPIGSIGTGEVNHFNIVTAADAHLTAVEVIREKRKQVFLSGSGR